MAQWQLLVSIKSLYCLTGWVKIILNCMVLQGKNYKVMKNLIPSEIDIACHNSPSSCTISGPTEIMRHFIEELKEKKIFVREVNSSNIAYHSRYIASICPKYISFLQKVSYSSTLKEDFSTKITTYLFYFNRSDYSCTKASFGKMDMYICTRTRLG